MSWLYAIVALVCAFGLPVFLFILIEGNRQPDIAEPIAEDEIMAEPDTSETGNGENFQCAFLNAVGEEDQDGPAEADVGTEVPDAAPELSGSRLTILPTLNQPVATETADDEATEETTDETTGQTGAETDETDIDQEFQQNQNQYQTEIFFFVGMTLFLLVALSILFAQIRVVKRHASIFWARTVPGTRLPARTASDFQIAARRRPPLFLGLWIILGCVFGQFVTSILLHEPTIATYVFPDIMQMAASLLQDRQEVTASLIHHIPWIEQLLQKTEFCAAETATGLADETLGSVVSSILLLAIPGLLFANIALVGYGTQIAARNYPSIHKSLKVRDELVRKIRDLRNAARTTENNGIEVILPGTLSKLLDGGIKNSMIADFVANYFDKGQSFEGIAHVSRKMSASDLATIIRILTQALLIVMLLALIAASLGMDLSALDLDLAKEEMEIQDLSYQAELLVMGLGFSLCLAVCYVIPMTRLGPYIEAEQSQRPATKGWKIEMDENRIPVLAEPYDIEPEREEFPEDLEYYIGADRAKFTTILDGSRYGGGFHMVLEQGLYQRLLGIAVLLAPTFVGGILGLIGAN